VCSGTFVFRDIINGNVLLYSYGANLYLEDGQIDKHLEQTEQQLLQQSNFWGISFQKGMVIGIEHALLQPDA